MPETTTPVPGTRDRHYLIASALIALGHTTRAGRLDKLTAMAGRPIAAFAALTKDEEYRIISDLADELAAQSEDVPGDG